MVLKACPVPGKTKSIDLCNAFIAGAPKDAEGVVFCGVKETNLADWLFVVKKRLPFYFIDNSFFDPTRKTHFRVAHNAIQINARAHKSDGKRFEALGLEVKPMQHNDRGHLVIVEQSPMFMRSVGEPHWFGKTVAWAKGTGRELRIRQWSPKKLDLAGSLQHDLVGAFGLVTHTSAAAVMALLEGIPAAVDQKSAVAGLRILKDNTVDDRRFAMNALADFQFTLNEMKEGAAWARLKT